MKRITLSTSKPATKLRQYAQRLSPHEHYQMARRILAGARVVVFQVDGERVTLAEQPSVVVEQPTPQLGPQQPPDHLWIYNRQMPDGTYRDLAGFFNRE